MKGLTLQKQNNIIKLIVIVIIVGIFIIIMNFQGARHKDDSKFDTIPLPYLQEMQLGEKEAMHYEKLAKHMINLMFEKGLSLNESRDYTEVYIRYLHGMLNADFDMIESMMMPEGEIYYDRERNEMSYRNYHYDHIEVRDIDTNGKEMILHLLIRNDDRYLVLNLKEKKLTFDNHLIWGGDIINALYEVEIDFDRETELEFDEMWETFIELFPNERGVEGAIISLVRYIQGMRSENELLINSFTDYPHSEETSQNIIETQKFFKTVKSYKMHLNDVIEREIDNDRDPTLELVLEIEVSFEKDGDIKSRTFLLKEHNKKITFTDITHNQD